MRIPLDRDNHVPLYQQIEEFLREQIKSGALPPKARLPASRDLANHLGVNRITVTTAYADLEAEGLIYSRLGSGTFVAPPPTRLPEATGDHISARDWPQWQQALLSQTWLPIHRQIDQWLKSVTRDDVISFADGLGATDSMPVDDFRKALQLVLRRDGVGALGYGERAGYLPLRQTIAQLLTNQGIATHPDHVLITSGSQQALSLIARLLLRPGDSVLVENPTYMSAIELFRSMDVRLCSVPMDNQGMQVDRVEALLRIYRPKLIYTMPNFQNPTGVCLSGARRRQLIALIDRYQMPIVEDEYVGDLRYGGHVQPALKTLDPGGHVIYVSTFSKMLMPGLRVGYLVAAGPVYDRLLAAKYTTDLATSNLVQRALEAYITVGRYEAHLRKACQVYRQRRDVMLDALKAYAPAGTRWLSPQGGLFIWLQLPADLKADQLYPIAAEEGVTFMPGSVFYPGERCQSCMRLNFAVHPSDMIQEGIRRLGRAIERGLTLQHTGPVESQPRRIDL